MIERIGSTTLGASHNCHHASSLRKIVIQAFAFQWLTQQMDYSPMLRHPSYAGLKLGETNLPACDLGNYFAPQQSNKEERDRIFITPIQ
jgi:hypothetical protein